MIAAELEYPIVQAPMAGGVSTPELAAAVSNAGALGFVAGGYLTAKALEEDLRATRKLTERPFGVNLFVPGPPADPATLSRYLEELEAEASSQEAAVGAAEWSDDDWAAKTELLAREGPAVVSFTFGLPDAEVMRGLREAGSEIWVTVTTPEEAEEAAAAGTDALVVQGAEAGAHQGGFTDRSDEPFGLLALLQIIGASIDLPRVATGGIATGAGIAAALAGGAAAAQLGTAFMLCPEAGTSDAHRQAIAGPRPTALTRAFTGRQARGIVNRFLTNHRDAPSAYPEIHYATSPIRAAARKRGDAEAINLWAGQAHALAVSEPAASRVQTLSAEARAALERSATRPWG